MTNAKRMKALSIRQPWAWLIIHGGKDIENRTWATRHRGPILIHAGKKLDKLGYETMSEAGIKLPPVDRLIYGGIIGQAEIVDCVTESHSPWFLGPIGFLLKNPIPIEFFKCKGQLALFIPK